MSDTSTTAAAEEMREAITYLIDLRDEAKPGIWTSTWGSATIPGCDGMGSDDVALIEVLHRTINAQIAVLTEAAKNYWAHGEAPEDWESFEQHAAILDLARAINGVTL